MVDIQNYLIVCEEKMKSSEMYIKQLLQENLQELQSNLKDLKFRDYCNQMSDDFYYTNGNKKRMDDDIKKCEDEINFLESVLDD